VAQRKPGKTWSHGTDRVRGPEIKDSLQTIRSVLRFARCLGWRHASGEAHLVLGPFTPGNPPAFDQAVIEAGLRVYFRQLEPNEPGPTFPCRLLLIENIGDQAFYVPVPIGRRDIIPTNLGTRTIEPSNKVLGVAPGTCAG
jgi:hypothetical protein